MKILDFQEKKRKIINKNLHDFQQRFWEWVFSSRWKPCPHCAGLFVSMWGQEALWSLLCSVCVHYFYYYHIMYVRAIKTVCRQGERNPSFQELENWYFDGSWLK